MAGGKTITQRIGLDGGDEVKAGLEAIGAAAQKAFKNLTDAANASPVIKGIGSALDAVRQKAIEIGDAFGRLGNSLQDFGSKVTGSLKTVLGIGAAITGAAAGFAFLVKGAADAAQQLERTAQAVGLTARELSNLTFAAGKSNVGSDQLVSALTKLDRALGESAKRQLDYQHDLREVNDQFLNGGQDLNAYTASLAKLNQKTRDQTDAFTRLGISTRGADGELRNPREVLLDLADAFKELPDGAQKTAFALELLGKGNANLIPFLNKGADGIRQFEIQAEKIAPALTTLQNKVGVDLSIAFNSLTKASTSAKNAVLLLFAPITTRFITALTGVVVKSREAFFNLADAIVTKVTPIVDDVIALLEGRDKDVKNSFVFTVRDAFIETAAAAQHAVTDIILPAFAALLAGLDVIAKAINGIFGTELTGKELAFALLLTRIVGLFGVLRAAVSVVISVIGVLVATFGALPVVLGVIAVAIGLFVLNAVGGIKGIQDKWNAAWTAIKNFVIGALDSIAKAARSAVDFLSRVWTSLPATIRSVATSIALFFADAWESVTSTASAVVQAIVGFFSAIPGDLGAIFTSVVATLAGAWQSIIDAASQVGAAIVSAFQAAWQSVVDAFNAVVAALAPAFQGILTLANTVWQGIVGGAATVGQGIVSAFQTAISSIGAFFSQLRDQALSIFAAIIDAAKAVAKAVKAALGGGGGGSGSQGFAAGGPVRGRGTSTSDSIRANLSHGEFVQPAKRVRQYGTAFMEAIRRGLIPAEAIRALMSRSLGTGRLMSGLAALAPSTGHFASGGLATASSGGGSGRPVNLHIGGESFTLSGSDDVIDQLTRFASASAVRAAGRKPSWFKG